VCVCVCVCVLLENSTLENQYELLDEMLWPISGTSSPYHAGRVHSGLGNTTVHLGSPQSPLARVCSQGLYFISLYSGSFLVNFFLFYAPLFCIKGYETINAYKILLRNLSERGSLGDLDIDGRIILKGTFKR
jgi:hypothetical protein